MWYPKRFNKTSRFRVLIATKHKFRPFDFCTFPALYLNCSDRTHIKGVKSFSTRSLYTYYCYYAQHPWNNIFFTSHVRAQYYVVRFRTRGTVLLLLLLLLFYYNMLLVQWYSRAPSDMHRSWPSNIFYTRCNKKCAAGRSRCKSFIYLFFKFNTSYRFQLSTV